MVDEELRAIVSRLDERSLNTWRAVEKIEKHLEAQNGAIQNCIIENGKNKIWRDTSKWLIGGLFSAIIIIFTKLSGLW